MISTYAQTVQYNREKVEQGEGVIFQFVPTESTSRCVAHSIIWEQDVMFMDQAILKLTPFNAETEEEESVVVLHNISGVYQLPANIYYSKIEIAIANTEEKISSENTDDTTPIIQKNFYGQVSFVTIEVDSIKPIEDEDWLNFLENTKLSLFSIPANTNINNIIDLEKVYEYVELFITADPGELSTEQYLEDMLQNPQDYQVKINDQIFMATRDWSMGIPGKAIPQNANIEKGSKVYLDIYLRYWTSEAPGVRL